jgi:hypothetical protein
MNARTNIYRLAIFGLLLAHSPRWLRSVIAYVLFGALLAVVVIIFAVSARATADGCAVVLRTPDGFLSLRKLPTADSTAVARLLPGEMLDIDDLACQKQGNLSICRGDDVTWMHVTGVPRLERKGRARLSGWVRGKYVKTVECDD